MLPITEDQSKRIPETAEVGKKDKTRKQAALQRRILIYIVVKFLFRSWAKLASPRVLNSHGDGNLATHRCAAPAALTHVLLCFSAGALRAPAEKHRKTILRGFAALVHTQRGEKVGVRHILNCVGLLRYLWSR